MVLCCGAGDGFDSECALNLAECDSPFDPDRCALAVNWFLHLLLTATLNTPLIALRAPLTREELAEVRHIFEAYAQTLSVDLGFQEFDAELEALPGDYAAPRGALLLAWVDDKVAGCCALRPLDNVDYANAAEMKRLFVHPAFRGLGLGRLLADAILDAARLADYSCVLLDTLNEMETARALYEDLGFAEVPPYYHNPHAGAHYLKVDL